MKTVRIIGTLLLAAACVVAHAHAFLERAEPRVGASVAQSPAELRLWFSEELDPASSRAEVTDPQGSPVDAAAAQVDALDHKLLRVPLAHLAPGVYTVTWHVAPLDAHASQGRFSFRVER